MARLANNSVSGRGAKAFTMIEILVVIVIMAVMMAIAIAGYIDWDRAAGMRGSVLNTRASLSAARQWAITHRTKTFFVYGNSLSADYTNRGYHYMVTGRINEADGTIDWSKSKTVGATNFLTEGIVFSVFPENEDRYVERVVFRLDGSADTFVKKGAAFGRDSVPDKIFLREMDRPHPLTNSITIYPLTGRCD